MALLGATSLTGCNSIPQFIAGTADVGASASRTVFRMATSPVSWTKDTTAFDGTLRVTNGASLSPGGSSNFPVVFTASSPLSVTLSQNVVALSVDLAAAFPDVTSTDLGGSGSVDGTTISVPTMGSHGHPYIGPAPGNANAGTTVSNITTAQATISSGSYGGGGSHNHSFSSHSHALGPIIQHTHTISGQHSHTVTSTQNFNVNYVDMIISIKD